MSLDFEILPILFCIFPLRSPQFITSRMSIHYFSPSISLLFTNQKVTNWIANCYFSLRNSNECLAEQTGSILKWPLQKSGYMKRGGNAFSLKMEYSIKTTGRIILPAMQRTVVHANFHWKLVQRYDVFLKVARILEEKSFFSYVISKFFALFFLYLSWYRTFLFSKSYYNKRAHICEPFILTYLW